MCYDATAVPPVPHLADVAVTGEPVTLTSADGTDFAAYLARPERSRGTGVLLLPDNRGLSGFYEQLAERFAERGYAALAIDYFARTAGLDYRSRAADFQHLENVMPHLAKLNKDTLYADFDAAIGRLRQHAPAVVSVGFCMGGRFALLTAAARFGLAGVVGFYGFPDRLRDAPGPTQLAATFTAPILALWGGGDEGIPPSVVAAFDEALTAIGAEHEFVTYPDAPHGFFELAQDEFADACADSWRRLLAFIEKVDS
ncbi:MAG TPA: dienelactone hydrolase family protein [Streptosporangiaceae bacterium]